MNQKSNAATLCFDMKMADVSNIERKVKLTKNGKIIKRRLRNPEGGFYLYMTIKIEAHDSSLNFSINIVLIVRSSLLQPVFDSYYLTTFLCKSLLIVLKLFDLTLFDSNAQ